MDSVVFPDVRLREMRTGIGFFVSPSDRLRLAAIISAPSSPQKHVWRARIVLLSADGTGTSAIMLAMGKPATCVWRWQERFMVAAGESGEGLCFDEVGEIVIVPGGGFESQSD